MAQTNPYYAQISQAEDELAALQSQWATLNSQWLPYTQAGNYSDPAGQRILEERDAVAARIRSKQQTIEQLRASAERWDAAVANNIAIGMTPEAAATKAEADLVRAEGTKRILTYVGIGLLVLAVVLAIVYFRKKKKG